MPFDFPWSHPLFALSAFLIGACVGSFLNVVIYRLPRGMSVNEPKRSFCPKCRKSIPMWRNIPMVTWLVQRGKCAECGEGIAFRYFVVELVTAVFWLGCWAWFDHSGEAVFYMVVGTLLLAVTVIDSELMVIPRPLTILGTLVGLLGAVLMPWRLDEVSWEMGLLKAGFGFALGWCGLWAMVLLGKLMFGKVEFKYEEAVEWELREPATDEEELCFVVNGESHGWSDLFFRKSDRVVMEGVEGLRIDGEERAVEQLEIHDDYVLVDGAKLMIEDLKSLDGKLKRAVVPREAMGMGDVDLLGMLGACFGPASLLVIILGACGFSLVWAAVCRMGFGKHLPFGPSLVAGAVLWVIWGDEIWSRYVRLLGV